MRATNRVLLVAAGVGFLMAGAGNATAGSMTCPGTASTSDREHTLTLPGLAVPTGCQTGSGNILNGNANDVMVQAGWTLLDKDENADTTPGVDETWLTTSAAFGTATTAHFDIAAAAWAQFAEISIGFKVGNTEPTWAVFGLPYLTLSGDWSTLPTKGGAGISHMLLYGKQGTPPPAVPEPASLLLLGSGLAATAAKLRRRKKV